jgi:hypothetical protein
MKEAVKLLAPDVDILGELEKRAKIQGYIWLISGLLALLAILWLPQIEPQVFVKDMEKGVTYARDDGTREFIIWIGRILFGFSGIMMVCSSLCGILNPKGDAVYTLLKMDEQKKENEQ